MKFSCADFTFPLLPHEKVLPLLRLLDFDGVDLGVFEGRSRVQPTGIAQNVPAAIKSMRALLSSQRLAASDVFLQTGPEPSTNAANSPDPLVRKNNRELFLAILEYAAGLDAKHMTGLPGVRHPGETDQDDWNRAVTEASWRAAAARQVGIAYAIEPHVGSLLPEPESALRFLAECPGLTLTLDYGHFLYQGIENERVHPLIAHASHFHARGGAKGQLQSTMRDNAIDFPEILRRFNQAQYGGWICTEYVWVDWEGCNRTDNLSETLLLRKLLESCSR